MKRALLGLILIPAFALSQDHPALKVRMTSSNIVTIAWTEPPQPICPMPGTTCLAGFRLTDLTMNKLIATLGPAARSYNYALPPGTKSSHCFGLVAFGTNGDGTPATASATNRDCTYAKR